MNVFNMLNFNEGKKRMVKMWTKTFQTNRWKKNVVGNASEISFSWRAITNSTYPLAGRQSNQRHPWAAAGAEIESRDNAGFMTIKEGIEFCPTCGRNSGLLEREKYMIVCEMLTITESPLLSEYYLGKETLRRPPLQRLWDVTVLCK